MADGERDPVAPSPNDDGSDPDSRLMKANEKKESI
jgi:hypothetical protein